jgi:hypothetical protein
MWQSCVGFTLLLAGYGPDSVDSLEPEFVQQRLTQGPRARVSILVNVHSAYRMHVTRKSVGTYPAVHQHISPNSGFTCLLCKLRFNR